MNNSHITEELEGVDLGDKRLNERAKQVLFSISQNSSESLKSAFNGWGEAKAAYRLLDNSKVTPSKIISGHLQKTVERFDYTDVVLCVQDTTIVDYSSRSKLIDGLGRIRSNHDQGLLLHCTVGFSEENLCLGLLDHKTWIRESLMGKKARHVAKPVELKESIRWIESYRKTEELAQSHPDKLFINISDREGDFYELFHEYTAESACHLIVRAKSNRVLHPSVRGKEEHLWERLKSQKTLGKIKFKMQTSGKKSREEREVTQTIKVCQVTIGPNLRKGSALKGCTREVTAVFASEENPPAGEEKIEWMLLTTLPVDNLEEAVRVINHYRSRWQIELYFKTLKSGCGLEKIQLESRERIERCLMLYMIVSWRIMFLTEISKINPDLSCEFFYDEKEWKISHMLAHKKKAKKPPTIREVTRTIAKLGGFLGRKNDGEPGIKSLWLGLQKLTYIIIGFDINQNVSG